MNIQTAITTAPRALTEQRNAWHNKSGVGHCSTCDDTGIVASNERPSTWNPYPEAACNDCSGEDTACEVCGNTVHVKGWDCLVCDMALEIPASQLDEDTALILAQSLVAAVKAAAKHRAQVRELAA
jgi:DnaJ-class molecular chaperone